MTPQPPAAGAASSQASAPAPAPDAQPTGTVTDGDKVKLNKDDDGSLIDPPVIQSYERELADASATGDQDLIDTVMENYGKARTALATRHAKRQREANA